MNPAAGALRPICSRLFLIAGVFSAAVSADVRTDGSLTGTVQAVTGDASATYAITDAYGVRTGGNLFFSFGEFDVGTGEIAEFRADSTITSNIIGRITDTNGASVFGTLRSTATGVPLWLISPNGWTFGAGARIDVPAALHLSTADTLAFADGEVFSASAAGVSVLSVDPPVSFGFLGDSAGTLSVRDTTLSAATDRVALSAGDISIDGMQAGNAVFPAASRLAATSVAPGARLDAASYVADSAGGSVRLTNSNIQLTGSGGPFVSIRGGSIEVLGTSVRTTSLDGTPGEVSIRGTDVLIDENSEIRSLVRSSAAGARGADIHISATGTLTYNGALQAAARAVPSSAGDVSLSGDIIELNGADFDFSRAAPGTSGALAVIATREIRVADASFRNVTSFGTGQLMRFQAPDIRIDNAFFQADTQDTAVGPGLAFSGERISLDNGTVVTADVERGQGTGITLQASDRLVISNDSLVTTESFDAAVGAPVMVTGGTVEIIDGGRITSDVVLDGGGGTLTLRVDELLLRGNGDDTGLFARSGAFSFDPDALADFVTLPNFALGDGGNIDIVANSIRVEDARISTDAFGRGSAGSISITTAGLQVVGTTSASAISSGSTSTFDAYGPDALGGGGNISIRSDTLQLQGDARIASSTDSNVAPGGDILIDTVLLQANGSRALASAAISALDAGNPAQNGFTGIVSNSTGDARGGAINLAAQNLRLDGAIVTASATSGGGGGDIRIGDTGSPVSSILTTDGSGVLARAQLGNGGNIFVFTDQLISDVRTVISADSTAGNEGTVQVEAPELDVAASITDLDVPLLDAFRLLEGICSVSDLSNVSTLVVAHQETLPADPTDYLPAPERPTDNRQTAPGAPACRPSVRQ